MVPEMKGWRPKKTIYTINDAWEDGYQVGYERGVRRTVELICYGHVFTDSQLEALSEYLANRPPVTNTKEEWFDILKKAVKG